MKHFKYLRYLTVHKWYTFIECTKRGIIWQGIVHDLSKFLPSEWFPYMNHFYGENNNSEWKGKTKPVDTGDKSFDLAWLKHIHRNPHHWNYYVLAEDWNKVKTMPMPLKYRKEMIADWVAAGIAQGHTESDECKNWYLKNKDRMILHPETRAWVEKELNIKEV